MNNKIKLLELANKKIASNKDFIAFFLDQYLSIADTTTDIVMKSLGCDIEGYYKLGLCRAPITTDKSYITDLNKIADYIGVSNLELGKIIRKVDTVVEFRNGNADNSYLMAARDKKKKGDKQDG
ncbi:MAG TPA: hypothetical protein VHA52_13310 [Candidatus Babeliaceae bacterium]|nr:hypothetical protein [Candidatus Babeliaceae bacterium]